jgi:hypothetical protein
LASRHRNTAPQLLLVCLFVCFGGVNKASQEGALQRHSGIELSFNIPMYGGYDLGCHRRFPLLHTRIDISPSTQYCRSWLENGRGCGRANRGSKFNFVPFGEVLAKNQKIVITGKWCCRPLENTPDFYILRADVKVNSRVICVVAPEKMIISFQTNKQTIHVFFGWVALQGRQAPKEGGRAGVLLPPLMRRLAAERGDWRTIGRPSSDFPPKTFSTQSWLQT